MANWVGEMKRRGIIVIAGMLVSCLGEGAAPSLAEDPMARVVRYADFGAKGDGQSDDTEAICNAHAYANEHGRAVRADATATYYLGGQDKPIVIQTDTDFGRAKFIIDDRSVTNIRSPVFLVSSKLASIKIEGVTSLKKNQPTIAAVLPGRCLITAVNRAVKQYIRWGPNQDSGSAQTDVFLVDAAGTVDSSTPILWDFDSITSIEARPVDPTKLVIRGGRFTTIANAAESKYTYYARCLAIRRSNVDVVGLEHYVEGEGEQGAPYGGFISISDCADVTVRDAVLTGRKLYRTIGHAGAPVSMGSYDISVNRAVGVEFLHCRQSNDIHDKKFWGIMASNYCKNLRYDGCTLSRFDAHKGVGNATIRNSTIGHGGISVTGHGMLLAENTTVRAGSLVHLRPDYGSTWDGELVIRHCVFMPTGEATLISGQNLGQHDFGYPCRLPWRITVDELRIEDANRPAHYRGPVLFANFNPKLTGPGDVERFPIVRPKEVHLKNVKTASGKPLRLSHHPFLFQDVRVTLDNTNWEKP